MILNFQLDGWEETKRKFDDYRLITQVNSERFVEKLLKVGQRIATEKAKDIPGTYGTHRMGKYVYFDIYIDDKENGCDGYLYGYDTPLQITWQDSMTMHTTILKPLLMLEFGSAGLAIPPQERFGGYAGQGTLAIKGHEKETKWHFIDEDGKLKVGTAIQPTQPMLFAYIDMMQSSKEIARKVFLNK